MKTEQNIIKEVKRNMDKTIIMIGNDMSLEP